MKKQEKISEYGLNQVNKANACMKKQEKISEYGLNQVNKGVLLLLPKLITVGEGIPTPNDVTGVFPWHHQWGKPSK